MRRFTVLFIALSLVLSSCGTLEISLETTPSEIADVPVDTAPEATAEPVLSLSSSSEEIQNAMLQSADKWKTIWLDGLVTWYPADGSDSPPQVYHEQVWIETSTPRFRTLLGPGEGEAEQLTACDGTSILRMDLKSGRSESVSLPRLQKRLLPTPHRTCYGARSAHRSVKSLFRQTMQRTRACINLLAWK